MKSGVEPLPLKPLQRSMVLASRRAPASGVYLIQEVCELNERCDVQRLLRAWQIVTKRHPALRSKIEFDGDNPVALGLLDLCNIEWQELDWTALPAEQQERQQQPGGKRLLLWDAGRVDHTHDRNIFGLLDSRHFVLLCKQLENDLLHLHGSV